MPASLPLLIAMMGAVANQMSAPGNEACLAVANFRTGEVRPLSAEYPTVGAFAERLRTNEMVRAVSVSRVPGGEALVLRVDIADALTGEQSRLTLELQPATGQATGCPSDRRYMVVAAAFDGERLEHPALTFPLLAGLVSQGR